MFFKVLFNIVFNLIKFLYDIYRYHHKQLPCSLYLAIYLGHEWVPKYKIQNTIQAKVI